MSCTGIDFNGISTNGDYNWVSDHEVIVYSNNKLNAKKKIIKWLNKRFAKLVWIKFVTDEMWKSDKSCSTKFIK